MPAFDYKKLVADLAAQFNQTAAADGLMQRLQWEQATAERNGGQPTLALEVAQILHSGVKDLKAEVVNAAMLLSVHPHLAGRAQKDKATEALYGKLRLAEPGRLWPGQSEEERQVILAYEIFNLRHITLVLQAGGYVTARHIAPQAASARGNIEMLTLQPLREKGLSDAYQSAAQNFLREAQARYSYLFPPAAGKPRRP